MILSISRKEAEQYIKDYFISYPGIKNYLDNSVKEAKEKGSLLQCLAEEDLFLN